jgi:branched-chain amino acid transport system substrate-binding protein
MPGLFFVDDECSLVYEKGMAEWEQRFCSRCSNRGAIVQKRDFAAAGQQRNGAAIILLLALFVAVLSPASAADNRPAVDPAPVGCILPLSGRSAAYGNSALDAILLAAGVFNAARETPIRLLIEDSQSDPAVAGAAVGKLAAAGVTCILGPLGSQEALEAAKEAQRLKVPILTLTQREEITGIGDYVFRNFLTAAMRVRTMVQYAQAEIGLRRFAILYPEDPYGQEMARLFREEVLRKGGEIRREKSYKTDQTDFGEEIRALAGIAPGSAAPDLPAIAPPKPNPGFEALFIPDSSSRVAMIIPQLAYHDITGIRLLGTSGWDSPELLRTDSEHLQGAIFVDGFFANSFRPEVNTFVEAFYMAYGREPDTMEALVYDAANMAVRLIIENRGGTREAFRRSLMQVKGYQGVTGRTTFSSSRDVEKELFVLMVKNGQIIQVR